MGITKRPPKEELLKFLLMGMSDEEIGGLYETNRATVYTWRRKYDLKPDGSHWPPVECENCHRFVSEYLRNGLCMACESFYRRNGYHRPKPQLRAKEAGWCTHCHEEPAIGRGLCSACYRYQRVNGKSRPPRFVKRIRCSNKNCQRPHRPRQWAYGRCMECYRYKQRNGVERPLHLCQKQAAAWCDCGHPATHLGVELPIQVANGRNVIMEKYDLCDDCMALELES